jgi:microsomal dipeptidase-like Zn-dependent dipeptidase
VVVERTIFSPFGRTPTLRAVDVPRYRDHAGHLNARGLTADGRVYARSLMSRGMLVGIEHMSQQSVEDLTALARDGGHPVFVGHAHFRALAIQERRRTTAEGFLPDEHDISDSTMDQARDTGGAAGVFLTENPIETHPLVDLPFANDCAGSSKTFALSLLYAMARMDYRGVGLATDFTFIPQTAPRFGPHACWALENHWDARPGAGPLRDQYHPETQRDGVRYLGATASASPVADNAPLEPYRMGERTYDFNVDGLAHYGMLPDVLQDLKNLGVGQRAFETLFSSAEHYLQMWERAERSAGTPPGTTFMPRDLPCGQVCKGLCP